MARAPRARPSSPEGPNAHPDLAPISERARRWKGHAGWPFWAACGLWPALYAVGANTGLGGAGALSAAVMVASLLAWTIGYWVAQSGARYGLPFGVIARAAFGPRGAGVVLLLRWLLGCSGLALGALSLGTWTRRWLVHLWPDGPLGRRVLADLPVTWVTLLLAAGLCGWAFLGSAFVDRVRRWAVWGTAAALVLAVASIAAAITLAGRGFSVPVEASPTMNEFGGLVLAVGMMVLPGVTSAADWTRFEYRRQGRRRAPSGAVLALTTTLMAICGFVVDHVLRGRGYGVPLADGALLYGSWGGGVGFAMSLMAWTAAAPTVGFYSPGLALCALAPRQLRYATARRITLAGSILGVGLLAWAGPSSEALALLSSLWGAPAGVLVADAWVRRHALIMDDVYLQTGLYGPWLGFSAAGWLALVMGWGAHSSVLMMLGVSLPRPLTQSGRWEIAFVAGLLIAAGVSAILLPVERRAARYYFRWRVARQARLAEARRQSRKPKFVSDASKAGQGKTQPHFTYDPQGDDDDPQPQ